MQVYGEFRVRYFVAAVILLDEAYSEKHSVRVQELMDAEGVVGDYLKGEVLTVRVNEPADFLLGRGRKPSSFQIAQDLYTCQRKYIAGLRAD